MVEVNPAVIIGNQVLQIVALQHELNAASAQLQGLQMAWAFCEGWFTPLREALIERRARARASLRLTTVNATGEAAE